MNDGTVKDNPSVNLKLGKLERKIAQSALLVLLSFSLLSCNSPFQPEVNYSPKLNVYSVLFANTRGVYVRVLPVLKAVSDSLSQPVHGATVTLAGPGPNGEIRSVDLVDSTAEVDGKIAEFYYAPIRVLANSVYTLVVKKDGFPTASATVVVPDGYATIPDEGTYQTMQRPGKSSPDIVLTARLSSLASAAFAQAFIEYRGLDAGGHLHTGVYALTHVDSLSPFTEINGTNNPGSQLTYPLNIDIDRYRYIDSVAVAAAQALRSWHLYVDVVVTQVDNNLYRFMITSGRQQTPLLMRTDKIVFTDIFDNAGTGIVAGASVDTTRIFLY